VKGIFQFARFQGGVTKTLRISSNDRMTGMRFTLKTHNFTASYIITTYAMTHRGISADWSDDVESL
jgi:hypothetical protein